MLLGDLEKQVLHYLWEHQNADAKQVHAALVRTRGGSLNTIQSTLDRLFKKALLSRTKQGHAYVYQPRMARSELIAQLIKNVTDDFIDEGQNGLLAAFASVSSELNEAQLDELESLIEQQRQNLHGKGE